MDITIVNPLTLEEKDAVRLAMLIDGEGMITLHSSGTKSYSNLMPKVSFFNSNVELVEYVIGIYNRIGVKAYVENARKKASHKFVYRVMILGVNRVYKVLTMLKPYLIGKKAQADIVLEFCNLRMNAAKAGRGKNAKYGPRELELRQQVSILNLRGVSETEHCEPRHFAVAGA